MKHPLGFAALSLAFLSQTAFGVTVEELKAFLRNHTDIPEGALGVFNALAGELVNVKEVAYLSGRVFPRLSPHPRGMVAMFQAIPSLGMDYDNWAGEFRVNDGRRWEVGEVHAFALISKTVWDAQAAKGRFTFTGSTQDYDGDYEMGQLTLEGTSHKGWVFATHQGLNRTERRRNVSFTICKVSLPDCKYGN